MFVPPVLPDDQGASLGTSAGGSASNAGVGSSIGVGTVGGVNARERESISVSVSTANGAGAMDGEPLKKKRKMRVNQIGLRDSGSGVIGNAAAVAASTNDSPRERQLYGAAPTRTNGDSEKRHTPVPMLDENHNVNVNVNVNGYGNGYIGQNGSNTTYPSPTSISATASGVNGHTAASGSGSASTGMKVGAFVPQSIQQPSTTSDHQQSNQAADTTSASDSGDGCGKLNIARHPFAPSTSSAQIQDVKSTVSRDQPSMTAVSSYRPLPVVQPPHIPLSTPVSPLASSSASVIPQQPSTAEGRQSVSPPIQPKSDTTAIATSTTGPHQRSSPIPSPALTVQRVGAMTDAPVHVPARAISPTKRSRSPPSGHAEAQAQSAAPAQASSSSTLFANKQPSPPRVNDRASAGIASENGSTTAINTTKANGMLKEDIGRGNYNGENGRRSVSGSSSYSRSRSRGSIYGSAGDPIDVDHAGVFDEISKINVGEKERGLSPEKAIVVDD